MSNQPAIAEAIARNLFLEDIIPGNPIHAIFESLDPDVKPADVVFRLQADQKIAAKIAKISSVRQDEIFDALATILANQATLNAVKTRWKYELRLRLPVGHCLVELPGD